MTWRQFKQYEEWGLSIEMEISMQWNLGRDDLHPEEVKTVRACTEYLHLATNIKTGGRTEKKREDYKREESDRMPNLHPMVKM